MHLLASLLAYRCGFGHACSGLDGFMTGGQQQQSAAEAHTAEGPPRSLIWPPQALELLLYTLSNDASVSIRRAAMRPLQSALVSVRQRAHCHNLPGLPQMDMMMSEARHVARACLHCRLRRGRRGGAGAHTVACTVQNALSLGL